jgi:hypothetical protein
MSYIINKVISLCKLYIQTLEQDWFVLPLYTSITYAHPNLRSAWVLSFHKILVLWFYFQRSALCPQKIRTDILFSQVLKILCDYIMMRGGKKQCSLLWLVSGWLQGVEGADQDLSPLSSGNHTSHTEPLNSQGATHLAFNVMRVGKQQCCCFQLVFHWLHETDYQQQYIGITDKSCDHVPVTKPWISLCILCDRS